MLGEQGFEQPASVASRCGRGIKGSVLICPLATCASRLPSASISPQPVVPRPGSRPRTFRGQLLQLFLGHVVIAPDGLDVVVFLERVDQLHQRCGVVAAHFDLGRGPPRQLGAFGFASIGSSASDFVQAVDAGPDAVATSSRSTSSPGLDRRFEHLVRSPARPDIRSGRALEPWLTLPPAPRLPLFLEKILRTLVAVRLRLSVSASTIRPRRPGQPRSGFLVISASPADALSIDRWILSLGIDCGAGGDDRGAQRAFASGSGRPIFAATVTRGRAWRTGPSAFFPARPSVHDSYIWNGRPWLFLTPPALPIGLEQASCFLGACVSIFLKRDDPAHRLGVVAIRLGLGIDVADIVRDPLLLLLEPLDALDKSRS